jgi:acyl-CoA thioesterase-1
MIASVAGRGVLAVLVGGVALAGAAAWVLGPAPPHRPAGGQAPTDAPPTVVFLGDSITAGHRLPRDAAFPRRLGDALGLRTVNAGVSGDTTGGGLARLERDVLAHRPRLVVVELGVNDVLGAQRRDATAANLRAIVRRIREHGAAVVLLHIRLPGVAGDGYRADLREIARSEGAILVEDFLDDVVPGHTYDGLHPDERGQARLAERLLPVLRSALAR